MSELRQRRPRLRDKAYLQWLRTLPCCCGCARNAPSDAAHIRAASFAHDKPQTGIGRRPDDCWAVPLNHHCHMRQHEYGELVWWEAHRVNPFDTAKAYYQRFTESLEL